VSELESRDKQRPGHLEALVRRVGAGDVAVDRRIPVGEHGRLLPQRTIVIVIASSSSQTTLLGIVHSAADEKAQGRARRSERRLAKLHSGT
jgi:hypothetical protein